MASQEKKPEGSRVPQVPKPLTFWEFCWMTLLVEFGQFLLTCTIIGAFATPFVSKWYMSWIERRCPGGSRAIPRLIVWVEMVPFLNMCPFFSFAAMEVGLKLQEQKAAWVRGAMKMQELQERLAVLTATRRVPVPLEEFGAGDGGSAEVVKWLVKAGDAVTEGQSVVELAESARGWAIEIQSPAAGAVASIKAEVGRIVRVGQVLLVLEVPEAQAPALERELGLFKPVASEKEMLVQTTRPPIKDAAYPSSREPLDADESWTIRKKEEAEEAPPPSPDSEGDSESWTLRKGN